jgi:hypothetical protein
VRQLSIGEMSATGLIQRGGHDDKMRQLAIKAKVNLKKAAKPPTLNQNVLIGERNPLTDHVILIDGIVRFAKRTRDRHFQIFKSMFASPVKTSFDAQTTFDRGFEKFILFNMYSYYSTILF